MTGHPGGGPVRVVRVYHTVRTAHLERARALAPATLLYGGRRADFDPDVAAGLDLRHAGVLRTFLEVARLSPDVLEVNEPLMRQALPRAAAGVAGAALGGLLRRRRPTVASYAIENRDPFDGQGGAGVRARLDRWLARAVARRVDRIVYGTDGAAELYGAHLGPALRRATAVTVPALPAPCACPAAEQEPGLVLFVGSFHQRKGVPELLAAWPAVAGARTSRLVLVGTGPLLDDVRAFAAGRPEVSVVVDPPRGVVHELQRRAQVAVLLSQRTPRWREQVGLPLVEGLAHGCVTVASTETGLAGWLAAHGHRVLDPAASPEELAAAVVSAIDEGRTAESVMADLPAVDGRLAADARLTVSPGAPSRAPRRSGSGTGRR